MVQTRLDPQVFVDYVVSGLLGDGIASPGHWTTDATWQDMVSRLRSLPGGLWSCVVALVRQHLQSRHWTSRHSPLVTGTLNSGTTRSCASSVVTMIILILGEQGNVFTMDTTMLATCHCVVSGPPCPPWSNIGLRAGD